MKRDTRAAPAELAELRHCSRFGRASRST